MIFSHLNINQNADELQRIYNINYYWYLGCSEFQETFLEPLGNIINRLGRPCLDVGCGEGWLADFVDTPYLGFDGSDIAIRRAHRDRRATSVFECGRIEDPQVIFPVRSTIVLGGLLGVLVKELHYIDFIEMYHEKYDPKNFIIYDLERLNTDELRRAYQVVEEQHAIAEVEGLEEVKCSRQILVLGERK